MTYRAWWAARRFLFEEHYGILIRQAEREQRAEEARVAAHYERSVAVLRARQQQEP